MRIGVDTGGTFTDCVVLEGSEVRILKVFSTPDDAAEGILTGVDTLLRTFSGTEGWSGLAGRESAHLDVVHGTTVGTNSLLERRGARVALITTAGFEDLIEIGRQARPKLYDFDVRRDPPLVPRALRFGVHERTAADGRILSRPNAAELGRLRRRIKRSRAQSIALCFLFSFANPANERRVARALRDLGLAISVSHEILPEFREYERLSTVVINAYLAPQLGAYLARLEESLGGRKSEIEARNSRIETGLQKPRTGGPRVFVMQSSGGITTAARAAREPVRTILSGPAGGVVAAAWLAAQAGLRRAISFDMGGTSTDVSLLDGPPRTTRETTLGGLPVGVPVIDVHSVGAGGGSMARIDAGGALRVGPESAGARPGPACYGRGGKLPTVTDANLLLGRLDPDHFLGGTVRLDHEASEGAFREFLGHRSRAGGKAAGGLATSLEFARGIVAVANATMERALRLISVERGHDPRDFALISFGGAGGLHAADLARSLGITHIVVPRNPGAFSALGILLSDIVKDASQSVLLPVPNPSLAAPERTSARARFLRDLQDRFARLEGAARAELQREGFRAASARAERRLDVRYLGQSYELSVPFTPRFAERFHREHEVAYGHAQPSRPLEIVNLRVRLVVKTPKPRRETRSSKVETRGAPRSAILKQSRVWFAGRFWNTQLYDRERLQPGMRLAGPAIVVEYSSTTVVPPGCECRVDRLFNLVLARGH